MGYRSVATQPWAWSTVVFRSAKSYIGVFIWHLWVLMKCPTKRGTKKDATLDWPRLDTKEARYHFFDREVQLSIKWSINQTRGSMRETRVTALLHVACGKPARRHYCMHGCKVQSAPTTTASCISSHAYSTKWPQRKNYECQKYERNHRFMRMRMRT